MVKTAKNSKIAASVHPIAIPTAAPVLRPGEFELFVSASTGMVGVARLMALVVEVEVDDTTMDVDESTDVIKVSPAFTRTTGP